jgi:acetyltransferase
MSIMSKTAELAAGVVAREPHPLDAIFRPKSVALVGASEREGSVGRTVMWNLLSSPFGGTIYPVNQKRSNILGVRTYPSLADLPERPDVVVITTPATTVPGILREAVACGIPGGIIISAGFKEAGPEGIALEREVAAITAGKMRVIGPNCLGVMSPIMGLNATFAAKSAQGGSVAFLSQSGALCTAVLDWSLKENVGFSGFVSMGSMLDVDFGTLVDYYGDDPQTKAIVVYMESIGDPKRFLSAARRVSLEKPIIVIKAGRTAAAAKAAASHTGSLTGSDEVLDAAFRRVGVLRVEGIDDIFDMIDALSKQPLPKGKKLCIVTNAGGPGVLATDALAQGGGELADISPESMAAFNALLPSIWSHNNPVDILGDAEPERYAKSLEIAAKDPNIDGMLVIMTPQGMTNPTEIAEHLAGYSQSLGKPVLASWMGGESVAEGDDLLNQAGMPSYSYPDTAVGVFNYMWQYSEALAGLYETPSAATDANGYNRDAARALIATVEAEGRTILTEYESKKLLEAYGIATTPTEIATSEAEAEAIANRMGYPIVLKLHSLTITHKTDVGGVVLNLRDAAAVKAAFAQIKASVTAKVGTQHFQGVTVQPMAKLDGYELILGASVDIQFGPVLLFGSGGQLVEVYGDKALGLPPLNTTLARRMMEKTKIYHALKGVRGRESVDMAQLESLLVRFSELIVENPRIAELDINPLLASPERLLALDARIVLHPAEIADADLPKPAIRPYPVQYSSLWTTPKGEVFTIRPVRPEDEPKAYDFHHTLSEQTVRQRHLGPQDLEERIAHRRLTQLCFIDYDREMSLVALRKGANGAEEMVAVARMDKLSGSNEAEFNLVVSDAVQGQGLGAKLTEILLDVARDEKVSAVRAPLAADNLRMRHIAQKLGFKIPADCKEGDSCVAKLAL